MTSEASKETSSKCRVPVEDRNHLHVYSSVLHTYAKAFLIPIYLVHFSTVTALEIAIRDESVYMNMASKFNIAQGSSAT